MSTENATTSTRLHADNLAAKCRDLADEGCYCCEVWPVEYQPDFEPAGDVSDMQWVCDSEPEKICVRCKVLRQAAELIENMQATAEAAEHGL